MIAIAIAAILIITAIAAHEAYATRGRHHRPGEPR